MIWLGIAAVAAVGSVVLICVLQGSVADPGTMRDFVPETDGPERRFDDAPTEVLEAYRRATVGAPGMRVVDQSSNAL